MVEFQPSLGLRLRGSRLVPIVVDDLRQLDNAAGVRFPSFEDTIIGPRYFARLYP